MDLVIWNHILYEITLAISGEQGLDGLIKKAATVFLRKLDCAFVSILQSRNNCLETACVIPRVAAKDPAFDKLISLFEKKMQKAGDKKIFMVQKGKGLHNYGFTLKNFGLLLLGKDAPIERNYLEELLPVTEILAQNCFYELETALKQQAIEAELEKKRHLLQVIIDTIPDLIFYKDKYGVYQAANKAANEYLLISPDKVGEHTDWDIHYQQAGKFREIDFRVMQSGCEERYENWLINPDGHLVPFETIKAPLYDAKNSCIGVVGVARNITERKRYEEQLKIMSNHDQLTGLYNRGFLEREIGQLDVPGNLPISIITGDLNGLKLINDVFGHHKGDQMLIKIAEIIKKSCRKEDLVARWGGDEFVVVLLQTGMETAAKIGLLIREKSGFQKIGPVQLSIALGCATKNSANENIWQVLKEASDKMYRDKIRQIPEYKKEITSSLRTVLFEKSTETEEHAMRLIKMCRKIGESMGLGPQQLDRLEQLAVLHDIGKVAIEEGVLLKPGPLTGDEWGQMEKHPEIGYRFARGVPELYPIAEDILSHHERWDGKGYPQGLQKKEIPLLARILAVADAFDAMTNDRIYRQAISREEALKIIIKNAGKQFDPEVVDVFCRENIAGLRVAN